MVFHTKPSNKRKRQFAVHQRRNSYRVYQTSIANNENSETVLEDPVDTPEVPPPANPRVPSKPRSDDNWRTNRAVQSAKRAAAKATAERDAVADDAAKTLEKLTQAKARVKEVEHQQFMERKDARTTAIKTEEEHKFALSELTEKYFSQIEQAQASVDVETTKRITEEELRIKSDQKHATKLRKERSFFSDKLLNEQTKLTKERISQEAVIDHMRDQWKLKLAATRLKAETAKIVENVKVMKKLKKKDNKLAFAFSENKKR